MTEKVQTINGKKPHRFFKQFLKDYRAGMLSRREFLAYSTSVGVTAASALALAGGAPTTAAAQSPKSGGTLRITMEVMAVDDPASYEWTQMGNATRGILEHLVHWAPDGTLTPHLLESWELSGDGLTWTLNLRKGVKWNNGDEFTSEDVAFNINRWLNRVPATTMQSRFEGLLEEYDTGQKDDEGNAIMAKRGIKNAVEIVDKHTVKLNSTAVDIAYIPNMGDYPSQIVHRTFEQTGSDILANPVGTGPFVLREYKVGERIIKERRPAGEYWDGDAYLERIVFVDLKQDPAQVFAAFSTDQIDLAYEVNPDQVERLQALPNMTKHEVATNSTGVIRFHIDTPPFDNRDLRRAIQLCADNAAILKTAHNNAGIPAEHHHVSPTHPEYAKLPELSRNIEEAKKHLKKAGMEGGEVECIAVNAPTWESESCLALASQAKEAGLTINVNILPGDAFWAKWDEWPFSMTGWNARPLGTQVYNLAYRSTGIWNETAYNNRKFDRTLDKANGVVDAKERSKLFARMQKMIQDDAIMVQPLWRGLFNFSNARVNGYAMHPAYQLQVEKVWLS